MPLGWLLKIGNRKLLKDNVELTPSAADLNTLLGAGLNASVTFKPRVNADVPGAGTVQADAAQLLEGLTIGTGANGTVGWKLPVATAGMVVFFKGTTAGVAKIWPNTGAAINAIAADTAMSLASGAIPAIFVAKSATQWYTFPLVPS